MRKYKKVVRFLRKNHAPSLPVEVRLKKGMIDLGEQILYPIIKYRINLNPNQAERFLIDALIHEWAHCLQDDREYTPDDADPHTDLWGTLYARLYRSYLKAFP